MKYHCLSCSYIYDEEKETISFLSLDAGWTCPECNASKSEFELVEEDSEDESGIEDEKKSKIEEDSKDEYY